MVVSEVEVTLTFDAGGHPSVPLGSCTWQCGVCGFYFVRDRTSFKSHLAKHARERGAPFPKDEYEALLPPEKSWKRQHTEACAAAYQEALAIRNAWLEAWPRACRACGAQGLTWQSNHRANVWCDACLRLGRCPRCAEESISTAPVSARAHGCSNCGWKFDDYLPGTNRCQCRKG